MHLPKISSFLLALCLSFSLSAATPAVFEDGGTLILGEGSVRQIRTADFNGDTKPDLAVLISHTSGWRLAVSLGAGNGTFAVPKITTPGIPATSKVTFDAADLNADGLADVAFAHTDGYAQPAVRIYRGVGDGSFAAGAVLNSPMYCSDTPVALADITNDGRPDILVCGVTIFPNAGGGSFGTGTSYEGDASDRIHVGDANDDGKLDVLLEAAYSAQLLLGTGSGALTTGAYFYDDRLLSVFADLNGDGAAEIVSYRGSSYELLVRYATPDGEEPYADPISIGFLTSLGVEAVAVESADMNADGRPDILAGHNGHVSIWLTQNDGTLGMATHYVAGSSAAGLAMADFDGDGAMDVATAGSGDASRPGISILRGGDGGTLRAGRAYLVPAKGGHVSSRIFSVGVSDWTGDGKLDAATIATPGSLIVLPGNGDGTTGAPIETNLFANGELTFVQPGFGDFDGDGVTDVMLRDSDGVHCWLAQGDGTFVESAQLSQITWSTHLFTGDFDGDGKTDLVYAAQNGKTLYFHPGNGDGTFAPVIAQTFVSTFGPILPGDVNGDGIMDLVAQAELFLGQASRTFSAVRYETFYDHAPAAVVDLNADGKIDVVKFDAASPTLSVFVRLGNGDGTFQPRRTTTATWRAAGMPPAHAKAGDFDADGKVDLTFGTMVFLGDGTGSFHSLARLGYAGAATAPAIGDFDGNGSSDLVFANGFADSVQIVRTWTSDSRALPLTIALEPPSASVLAGATVYATATVTGVGAFAPMNAVGFGVAGTVNAFGEIVNGIATANVLIDRAGTSLTARFGGDAAYGSASASVPLQITKVPSGIDATTTPNPATNATITRITGTILTPIAVKPTGVVTVLVDGVVRGTGWAPDLSIPIGLLPVGDHTVTVQYPGDGLHHPSDDTFGITVQKEVPTLTLAASPSNQAKVGALITLIATIKQGVTGSVQFYRGPTLIGTAAFTNGVASITTSSLPVGTHSLQARFAGDSVYAPSSSPAMNYKILDLALPLAPSALYVIAPCRIIDTRGSFPIYGNGSLSVPVSGVCGIPQGAKAVAANITVVTPKGTGFLTLYPGASPLPNTSTMSYRTGKTRATHAIVALSAGGIANVFNGGPAEEHFIIDVMAYFK